MSIFVANNLFTQNIISVTLNLEVINMLTKIDMEHINTLKNANPEFKYYLEIIESEHAHTLIQIAQDLRNILTLPISSMQFLEEEHPEIKKFKYWPAIMSDLDYLRRYLENLSFYNYSSKVNKKIFAFSELFSDLIGSVENKTTSSQVLYESDIMPNAQIYADYQKLFIALRFLIANAYEAIEADGSVSVFLTQKEDFYLFRVIDNGCGISSNRLNHILEPLMSDKRNHIGFSLASCNHIIIAHGGYLEINSSMNQGTAVSVYLPVYKKTA